MNEFEYDIIPVSDLRTKEDSNTSIEILELAKTLYEFDAKTEVFEVRNNQVLSVPKFKDIKIAIYGKPTEAVREKIAKREPFRALLIQDGENSFIMK